VAGMVMLRFPQFPSTLVQPSVQPLGRMGRSPPVARLPPESLADAGLRVLYTCEAARAILKMAAPGDGWTVERVRSSLD